MSYLLPIIVEQLSEIWIRALPSHSIRTTVDDLLLILLLIATSLRLIHYYLLELISIILAALWTLSHIVILIERKWTLRLLLEVIGGVILEWVRVLKLLLDGDCVAWDTCSRLKCLDLHLTCIWILLWALRVHLSFDLCLRWRHTWVILPRAVVLGDNWLISVPIGLHSALLALIDEDLVGVGCAIDVLDWGQVIVLRFYLCSVKWALSFLRLSHMIVRLRLLKCLLLLRGFSRLCHISGKQHCSQVLIIDLAWEVAALKEELDLLSQKSTVRMG